MDHWEGRLAIGSAPEHSNAQAARKVISLTIF